VSVPYDPGYKGDVRARLKAAGCCVQCWKKHTRMNHLTGTLATLCVKCNRKATARATQRYRDKKAGRVRYPTFTRRGHEKSWKYEPTAGELRFVELKLARLAAERRARRVQPGHQTEGTRRDDADLGQRA